MGASAFPCCKFDVLQEKSPVQDQSSNSARHPCGLAKCEGCPAAGGPSADQPEPEVPWPPQPINKGVNLMFISSSIRYALHCSPAPTLCYKQDRGLLMSLTFLSGTAALRWQLSVFPPHIVRGEAVSPIFFPTKQAGILSLQAG